MLSRRPRGRLAGIEINPAALRQARLKAGLSLAQVGGTELTRQAVHLIETGKVRPSRRSLNIIASRLRIPEGALLSQPGASQPGVEDCKVAELEDLCQRHEYLRAVARGEELLNMFASIRLHAFAHHYTGTALYALARPEEALTHVREARELFEVLENPWFVAESMDWEAMSLYLKESPDALTVAEEALRRYRSLEPRRSETEARIVEHIGTILIARKEHGRARRHFDEALRVAGTMRDLARTGRIYHGLARSYYGLGDLRRATDLLTKAVALYEAEHHMSPAPARAHLPRAENDLGMLMLEQGDLERADDYFQSALTHFAEAGAERLQSDVLLSLAELQQRRGRIDRAFDLVQRARSVAERFGETLSRAAAHKQLAELHAERGDWAQVAVESARALAILETAGLNERRSRYQASFKRMAARHRRTAGQPAGQPTGA